MNIISTMHCLPYFSIICFSVDVCFRLNSLATVILNKSNFCFGSLLMSQLFLLSLSFSHIDDLLNVYCVCGSGSFWTTITKDQENDGADKILLYCTDRCIRSPNFTQKKVSIKTKRKKSLQPNTNKCSCLCLYDNRTRKRNIFINKVWENSNENVISKKVYLSL